MQRMLRQDDGGNKPNVFRGERKVILLGGLKVSRNVYDLEGARSIPPSILRSVYLFP